MYEMFRFFTLADEPVPDYLFIITDEEWRELEDMLEAFNSMCEVRVPRLQEER